MMIGQRTQRQGVILMDENREAELVAEANAAEDELQTALDATEGTEAEAAPASDAAGE